MSERISVIVDFELDYQEGFRDRAVDAALSLLGKDESLGLMSAGGGYTAMQIGEPRLQNQASAPSLP